LRFNAAFAMLAARFDYPDILRQPSADLLAKFRAGSTPLVSAWRAFALTAVFIVPLVVSLSRAIDDADPTLLAVATTVGVLAALVQFLGLVRWPFYGALTRSNASPSRAHETRARKSSRALPAPEPADERAEHKPGLRCQRDTGGHADDDAERQAHSGSDRDRGSDAHARQCRFGA
jgi:hypothetical protein